ncbi:helix-turn-helix transcriptional regulator [Microbacterium sp. HA-8]|uniref:helix-turn-helix transcriptional regulator n=1 Tax=Microbacterium sp. HA-8 TaxID=3234200 RepID=UPI0038F7264F
MTTFTATNRPFTLPELFTQNDIAHAFGLSPRTLEDWRVSGNGPPYLKLSYRCVRYELAAVENWLRGARRG